LHQLPQYPIKRDIINAELTNFVNVFGYQYITVAYTPGSSSYYIKSISIKRKNIIYKDQNKTCFAIIITGFKRLQTVWNWKTELS
jgi:hypothetical protein